MTGDLSQPGGATMPPQRFGTTVQLASVSFGWISARRLVTPASDSTATTAAKSTGVCILSDTSITKGRSASGSSPRSNVGTAGSSLASASGIGQLSYDS